MKAVVDASVALKWQFENEEASEPALTLLRDYIEDKIELATTTLFPYEILSAIHVAVLRKRTSEAAGRKALTHLISLGIEERSFDDWIEATFRSARKYQLSTYDCAYLVLAEREGCDLITGDKKLFKTIKTRLSWVKWVGNY